MPDLASVSSTKAESDSSGLDYISKLPNHSGLDTRAPILTTPTLMGGGDKGASSSTNGSVIKVSDYEGVDAPIFNAQEWIGCRKIWSDPMPVKVCAAPSAARWIPDGITPALIPDMSVSVLDLLVQSVQCSRSVDMSKYDTALPNTLTRDPLSMQFQHILSQHRSTLLASLNDLPFLRQHFNSAWLSGSQSICLPSDPLVHFPLWIEHLLSELDSYSRNEQAWVKVSDWLHTSINHSPNQSTKILAGRCLESWDSIPWDGLILGLGRAVLLMTKDLAKFLTNEWLNDEMINAGLAWISHHISSDRHIRVLNVLFVNALRNLCSTQRSYGSRHRQPLNRLIADRNLDTVYVPLHINGNHWTLLQIDLNTWQYAYGNSLHLSAEALPEVIGLLNWWLNSLAPGSSLTPSIHRLIIPHQEDNSSCSVIVLSTLACKLIDECGPWEQQFHASEQMEWYLRLSKGLWKSSDVSRTDLTIMCYNECSFCACL